MPNTRSRRLSYANVVATLALVMAMSGGALAATHYLITSTKQISPRVLRTLRGRQGPAGPRGQTGAAGAEGPAGTGPAIAVYNDAGYTLTGPGDDEFHTIATLSIPGAGDYIATAKVHTYVTGGSGIADSYCALTADAAAGGTDDTDTASAYVTSDVPQQTLPLEVVHDFTGPGTIVLACQQNGSTGGGAYLTWDYAKIIATQVSSLSNTAVTG